MAIIVNGTPYDTWDDVPQRLRIAIANSGAEEPEAPDAPVEEVDELDELVRLADAAEARRAGIEPDAPPPPPPPPPGPPAEVAPTFELNGQVYRSIDDVPAEIREALRLQLLGPPAPSLQPRVPAALDGVAPPNLGAVSAPPSMGGTGLPSAYEPIQRPSLLSQVSMKYRIAMAVMLLLIVAIYVAIGVIA